MSKTCNTNVRCRTPAVSPYGSTHLTPHHFLLCTQLKSAMKPRPNITHKQYKATGSLSTLMVGMRFQAIKKLNKERVYLTNGDHAVYTYFTVQFTTAFKKSVGLSHTVQNSRHLTELHHVEPSRSCSTWRTCKTAASRGLLKTSQVRCSTFTAAQKEVGRLLYGLGNSSDTQQSHFYLCLLPSEPYQSCQLQSW